MAGSKTPRTYEEAVAGVADAKAQANKVRLTDPDDHFPYKRDEALERLRTGPDRDTNDHPAHWYTSEDIIERSAEYVAAQEAWIRAGSPADPQDETKQAYEQAKRELSAARERHRRGRPLAPVAVAGSPQEIEQRNSAIRALGAAGYDAGVIAGMMNRPVAEVQGALNGRKDD